MFCIFEVIVFWS